MLERMSGQRDRGASIGGASAEGRPADSRTSVPTARRRHSHPSEAAPPAKRVSVIIPAFNVAPYIAEALASVVAQRFPASRDRDRQRWLVGRRSIGARDRTVSRPARLHQASQQGRGRCAKHRDSHGARRWVAFLDGDDVWMPDFLESQVAFLEKTGFDMVYSDAFIFGDGVSRRATSWPPRLRGGR